MIVPPGVALVPSARPGVLHAKPRAHLGQSRVALPRSDNEDQIADRRPNGYRRYSHVPPWHSPLLATRHQAVSVAARRGPAGGPRRH
jgi:hypothetical protein